MRIALIADTFPPLRSSGAVQLRDLAREFAKQGHDVTVMLPASDLGGSHQINYIDGVRVARFRAPNTKDIGYVRRTIAELMMPFAMLKNLRSTALIAERWDGVVWYSPTIFLGPVASVLKRLSGCRSYLVVRDIFPEWAHDLGLLRKGLAYWFFKAVAGYQYSVADVIGIQTAGNAHYFARWAKSPGRRLEVLQNWVEDAPHVGCTISLEDTKLAGRKIFAYAGNMGVAQGLEILIDLAHALRERADIGFLFVGRGQSLPALMQKARSLNLNNVLFHNEIAPEEIPGLYAQCHVGIVALDTRHKTHNIPGKFLTYMQGGLPVLACLNDGNDLAALIKKERVGRVCSDRTVKTLVQEAESALREAETDLSLSSRCRALYTRLFSPENAAKQIAEALKH